MLVQPATAERQRRRGALDRAARRSVQLGFLLLFLYPLALVIYQRVTFRAAPSFASWLLPWDPLLLAGHLAHRNWAAIVIGAPLFLLALTLLLGRFFCGWVCPIGAVLDLVRPLAFWRRSRPSRPRTVRLGRDGKPMTSLLDRLFGRHTNSRLRYFILIGVVGAGIFSLQALGLLDPLVIFHRTATALASNAFALRLPPLRTFFSLVSFIFLAILLLELWQPRFWCRHLCPLGALISVFSRFSLLNRRVSSACTLCGECQHVCAMNAIPRREPHDTDYTACTFCLECESACPNGGISFGFGGLARKRWQRQAADPQAGRRGPQLQGAYVARPVGGQLSRRELIGGVAAGVAGIALAPAIQLARGRGVLRPPGALPEEEFVRTCILCQECVRVCPTGGLKPITFEGGLAAVGTPHLVPRVGACTRNPSCPHLCAQVCPVAAIRPIAPEQVKIGRAVVKHDLCLAWDQQVKCLVCVEACLVEAAQMYNGRIIVDPVRCTGCGRPARCPRRSS
ncbi:MAG: 4Fe-4S binding protein, partial [Anaerolineae bacterium]|nr:4Fe-4S binding protein [Anaerolineae bacterium]